MVPRVKGTQMAGSSIALGSTVDSKGSQNSCQSGLLEVGASVLKVVASSLAMSWRSSSSRRLLELGVRVEGRMVEVMVSRVVGEDCHLLASPATPHHQPGSEIIKSVH